MSLPEFLTQDEFGSIRLTGHRIDLGHLLYFYNEGYSPEMLWNEYSTLSLGLIHKVIAYYLENHGDVDVYLASFRRTLDQHRTASPAKPSFTELRRRLESQRKAQGA